MSRLLFPLLLLLAVALSATAGGGDLLRESFTSMPDSLSPYLTRNNRLDMLDFMDSHMKAEVTNQLEGKSEMALLTSDSLSVRLSASLSLLLTVTPDSLLLLERTWHAVDGRQETVRALFDRSWRPVGEPQLKSSTILNYFKEIRNKR